jgi:uncharacterized membrane protein
MSYENTEQRLSQIESRLSAIETLLGRPQQSPTPIAPKVSIPLPPRQMPSFSTSNGLAIISMLCFVVAAAFIIKLAISSGWLTPLRQVGIAVMFGVGLILSGLALIKKDRAYASYLPAAGVTVLFLAVVASHGYYRFLSFHLAMAALAVVSLTSLALYMRIKHEFYAFAAAAGSYIAPFFLSGFYFQSFTLYYYAACTLTYAILSVEVKSRSMIVVCSYLAIIMTTLVGLTFQSYGMVAGNLVFQFLVFLVATYLYTKRHQTPLTVIEASAFLPVLVVFYAAEYLFLNRATPHWAPWLSLGFAGVLLALYWLSKKRFASVLASEKTVLTFVTLVCFHSGYFVLLPEVWQPWLLLFIVIGVILGSLKDYPLTVSSRFKIPLLAIAAIFALEFIELLFKLIYVTPAPLYVSFFLFAGMWAMVILKPVQDKLSSDQGIFLLYATHFLAVLALYRLAVPHGSLAVSASWLVYAMIVMGVSVVRRDATLIKSALFVLGLAAAKALLYDAQAAATVIRIVCLLLTGAVLYGCGYVMKRVAHWTT